MILNDPKVHGRVIKEISAAQDSSGIYFVFNFKRIYHSYNISF